MATRLQAVHRGRTSRRTHVTAAAQQRSEQLLSGLDPIIMKINQKIAEGHSNVMAEFRDWDTDRNNQVTKAEFKAALAKMGYEPSKAELAAFFKRFDKDNSGFIAYAELNKVLKEPPKQKRRRRRPSSSRRPRTNARWRRCAARSSACARCCWRRRRRISTTSRR